MELISREEAMEAIRAIKEVMQTNGEVINALYHVPTIESRPKGKWIGGTTDCFQCSNCKELSFYPSYVKVTEVEWNFCPYCGADMRGEE